MNSNEIKSQLEKLKGEKQELDLKMASLKTKIEMKAKELGIEPTSEAFNNYLKEVKQKYEDSQKALKEAEDNYNTVLKTLDIEQKSQEQVMSTEGDDDFLS